MKTLLSLSLLAAISAQSALAATEVNSEADGEILRTVYTEVKAGSGKRRFGLPVKLMADGRVCASYVRHYEWENVVRNGKSGVLTTVKYGKYCDTAVDVGGELMPKGLVSMRWVSKEQSGNHVLEIEGI